MIFKGRARKVRSNIYGDYLILALTKPKKSTKKVIKEEKPTTNQILSDYLFV